MSDDENTTEIEAKIENKHLQKGQKSPHDVEKDQEAKLRSKYPGIKPGGSSFLQKRLSKGTKFFDSGDYNMAKAKMGSSAKPVPMAQKLIISNDGGGVTGDTIPTPDTVPQRKASLHQQSKLVTGIPL